MPIGFDRGHLSALTEKQQRFANRVQADRDAGFSVSLSRFSSDRSLKMLVQHPGRLPVDGSQGEIEVQNSSFENVALDGYSWPSGPDVGS